jgi:hypothetical protein
MWIKKHNRNLKSFEINTVQYDITLDRGIDNLAIHEKRRKAEK